MTEQSGTHNYAYDVIYRLLQATHPAPPTEQFTYDQVGNRLTDNSGNEYFYNNANRLLNYNGLTFTYDANGNMTSRVDSCGTTTYTWDSENRLTGISGFKPDCSTLIASYQYDPFGRRIEKNINEAITKYLYDEEDIIAEYDGNNQLIAHYIHGPGIEEPIAMVKNSQSYFYHFDGLGSVTALTDSTGNVVQRYNYDSFGNITNMLDPNFIQPFTYTSREYDPESGLYYYRARYYDSKIGRFISEDPIRLKGGINFYLYVYNRPTMFIDPSGLLCVYSQSLGSLTCTNNTTGQQYLSCNGYAGKGPGLNKPSAQNQPNVGPLPQGDYTMGGPNNRRGPFTRPLMPDPGKNMFGRSGFLIHGDNAAQDNSASEGCIVVPRDCRSRIPTGETLRVVP